MHDSYTPIGGLVPLINMLLGEMIFGGLGTGIYSIIMVALVALFLAGLMIGRTPAYLGKRIRAPTHHPRSSPTRSASRRAQRCATRSSAAPTGPPTPLEDVLTPDDKTS